MNLQRVGIIMPEISWLNRSACQKDNAGANLKKLGRNVNKKNGFAENADWLAVGRTYGIHPWIRWGDNYICRESGYVGKGESYVIERRKGSQTKGWQPYC